MTDQAFINLIHLTLALCVLLPTLTGIVTGYAMHIEVLIEEEMTWSPCTYSNDTVCAADAPQNTRLVIKKERKTMYSQDLAETITLARVIAADRHENAKEPLFGPLYGHEMNELEVVHIINNALEGKSTSYHPNTLAIIADCQAAKALLDRAEHSERTCCWRQANDYREGARRKIAEAVSYAY